ncbi:putative ABC transport system permease protein [Lipingzhangella halophila]|uniref:Putative ABC transport system permease protein n=1 Tax=Lipingzhangella halophila TaxID=1783352 RepID=A0A7W7RK27_9ACTN|nr:FtsX-like permease family protein [Lipingzhangella halophila]MBB4933277.1 putative ABC transport system permease protein [Lipingzhangella halophila]
MLGITLANLRAHKGRLLLSSLAIVLATAFVAAAFVFTDAMRAALSGGATEDLGESDVVVTSPRTSGNRDVPAEVLDAVREVDSVAGAERRVTSRSALRSTDDRFEPAAVVSVTPDTGVGWPEVVRGELADQPGEAVLDRGTARTRGVDVGDTVSVPRAWEGPDSDAGGNQELRVVGLVDVADSASFAGSPFVGVTAEQVRALTDDSTARMVLAVARDDVSAADLAAEVDNAVAGQFEVRTAEEHASQQTSAGGAGMRSALLGFAGVALLVAAIVIANTFSILLAQRTREMALLRCVGATRGQVFRSVVAESVVLGLAGSAVGVLTGFGLAYGVGAVLDAAVDNFPLGAVTLSATAVLVPVAVGVPVTVGAAILPARAATRIPPVAALRDQATPARRAGWMRVTFAAAALLTGATGLVLGTMVVESPETALLLAFAGGASAFLGVLLAGPTLLPPFVRLVGAVLGRALGTPGRLAAVNVTRNPRRSAATVSALLVGVTLVSLMSVGAASVRATVTSSLNEEFPVDYMVQSEAGMPASVGDNIRDIRGLSDVTVVRGATADLHGSQIQVTGYNPRKLAEVTSQLPEIAGLEQGEVVLTKKLARRLDVGPGDAIRLGGDGGNTATLTVSAVQAAADGPEVAHITHQDLERILPEAPVMGVFARAAPEADLTQVSYALNSATVGDDISVVGTAETKAVYTETLDTVLLVFTALLAIALIIAVVGIANTLALSVIERTRELALLRALGLTRGQLRATLAVEAALLAAVGALLGAGLGTVFGWAGITTILASQFEVVLSVPELRLAGLIAGAVLAGLLASVLPARRAARTSVVSALADE